MQAVASYNKTILLAPSFAALAFQIGAFIATCVYVGNKAIDSDYASVGGRIGFALIFYSLLAMAFWAFASFTVIKGNFSTELFVYVQSGAVFLTIFAFYTCLVIHGQAIQLIKFIQHSFDTSIPFHGAWVHGADGSVALLSLQMVCAIVFIFFFTLWKNQILGSSGQGPQQPADMGYAPQQDQNSYYNQQAPQQGGYAQPQQDPGAYAAPQNSGVYA